MGQECLEIGIVQTADTLLEGGLHIGKLINIIFALRNRRVLPPRAIAVHEEVVAGVHRLVHVILVDPPLARVFGRGLFGLCRRGIVDLLVETGGHHEATGEDGSQHP